MRARISGIALAMLLVAALPAFAEPVITSVTPEVVTYNGGNHFIIISGSGFRGTQSRLRFSGPTGDWAIFPRAGSETMLDVWIPADYFNHPGRYEVRVSLNDTVLPEILSNTAVFYIGSGGNPPPPPPPPTQIVVEATGPAGATVNFAVDGSDEFNGRPPSGCAPASGSVFPIGTTLVTCTSTSFQVIVRDTKPPVLSLPSPITVEGAQAVTFTATATDIVDGNVAVVCNPASGATFSAGTTTVSCSASDSRGNSAGGSFTVTVTAPPPPPPPPTWTLPDITAEATGPNGAVVTFNPGQNGSGDDENGRPIGAACNPPSGTRFPLGATTVNCTAKDIHNQPMTTSFTVTVVDTTAPSLTLPADITVEGTSVVTWSASATDTVDGNVTVVCTPPPGSSFSAGTTTVNCSAADSRGNSASGSFNVTVNEPPPPPPPDWTLPDVTVEATGPNGAIATFDPGQNGTGDDENGRPLGASCTPPSGSLFPLGDTLVRCTARNAQGQPMATTFTVHVVDTTAPGLTLPGPIAVQATDANGAVVTFTASAEDLVDGSVAVSCTPASGATFPVGFTTVQCSATDAHDNTAEGTFSVSVADPAVVDTTPPVLSLPSDITVEAAASGATVVTFTATATDDVDGNVPVVCTPPSGSTFALGTTAVNCTATDAHGNAANGSFQVHVVDTTAPVIVTITATPGNLWPPNHKMVDVVVSVDVSDGSPVTAKIIGVTSSDPEDNNNTSPDWIITGDLTLQLRSERSNPDKERKYTIEVEVVDASALRTVGTVVVGVKDEPRPEEVTAHGTIKTKRK